MPSRLLSPKTPAIPANPWLNRRVAVRHTCRRRASSCVAAGAETRFDRVQIHDISTGGIAVILSSRLKTGTRVLIRMNNKQLRLSYDLSARVAHCQGRPRGKWLVGCSFSRELSDIELGTLL